MKIKNRSNNTIVNDLSSRIVFNSELFYPNQTSTAYYITEIVRAVAKETHRNVIVFCATDLENYGEISQFNNLTIHRIDKGKGNKNRLLARILKFMRISLKMGISLFFLIHNHDTLFCVTNPPFALLFCAFLKKIRKIRFILLVYDVFPENLVAIGLLKNTSILYRFSKLIYDWGYKSADNVISIGRDVTDILIKKGVSYEQITQISNWSDPSEIKYLPKEENAIIIKYGLENKRVFLFAGNFGRVQGISELLHVIDHVSAQNAAFLFIGDGAMKETIERYRVDNPQKAIILLPYMLMEQQNIFLNACDVAIISLSENMLGLGVPSKSYYSLMSGHPILYIGNSQSEIAFLIEEGKCGWSCSFDNIDKCARVIDQICNLPQEEISCMGTHAREFAKKNYSKDIILREYVNLICKHT
jgi:glycosyltransferase involved in cell wall biosynthesis